MKKIFAFLLVGVVLVQVRAQENAPDRLMQDPAVKAALEAVKANEPSVIADQIRLSEIPAPPFQESKRAQAVQSTFSELGLTNVRIDKAGNVIGERPGQGPGPDLLFCAHLDTVFPGGTSVKTSRNGTAIQGPGIGDDARGLAVMIGVVRALNRAQIRTRGSIYFVADVGEEGLGDLRGVKQLFQDSLKGRVACFVSVDGSGLGITNIGVGSYRYRVTYKGPGGHSFGAFGIANPIHALGRAMAKISNFEVPAVPKTTFNVGRIGGGTSVNSIAFEAWMEMDMRSSDMVALAALDAQFRKAVDHALVEENDRWHGRGALTLDVKKVGERPAGRTAETSAIVQTAVAVTKALGFTPRLGEGSTDGNYPMSLGIPSITIGGGGGGSGAHSLGESFDTTDSWKGTQRALLVAIALAQKQ